MNTVHVHGRVGKDAVTKQAGEYTVAEFSLADDRFVKGERTTQWWRVTVWGKGAEFAGKLTKGDYVIVQGQASARAYKADDGEPRVSLEISANSVDRVNMGNGSGERAPAPTSKGKSKASAPANDDIPF